MDSRCACGVQFTLSTPGFLHIQGHVLLIGFDGIVENIEGMYLHMDQRTN